METELLQIINKVSMGEAWGALTVSKTALHLYTLYLISIKGDHNLQGCCLIPFTTTKVIIKERKDNYRITEPNDKEKAGKHTHLWLWLKHEQRPSRDACCEHEQRPSPSSAPNSLFCMLQYFKILNRGFSSFFNHRETTMERPLFDTWHLFGLSLLLPSQIR